MGTMGNRDQSQLSTELREILRCIGCGAGLEGAADGYACSACGKKFPLVRGVYRFVDEQNYAASFGWQWHRSEGQSS